MKQILYYLTYGIWYVFSVLPWRLHYIISDVVLYPFVRYVIRYRGKLVRQNIRESFPEKSESECRKVEKAFYHWFCDYIVETIKHLTMSPADIHRHMKIDGVQEMSDDFRASGKSLCVLYLGHYNNWEWVSALGDQFDDDIIPSQIYHPLHNKILDRIFLKNRGKCGAANVAMRETLRFIISQRRAGKKVVMGFIADQRPRPEAIHHWIQWLNHETPVITGAETIGSKIGAIYYYADVRQVKRGYYHTVIRRMEIEEQPVLSKENHEEQTFPMTDAYMKMMEESIRQCPGHYLWTHNRWKYKRSVKALLLFLLAAFPFYLSAQTDLAQPGTFANMAFQDSVSAQFFRERMPAGDLVSYLQAVSDHTIYEGNHQGQWSQGDQLIFSVDGSSYRQNKYYIDGFRVNNRFTSGSTLYVPNMQHYNLFLNTHSSILSFEHDTAESDYVQVTGNFGNLGGINSTTEGIIHLFHGTGSEGLYNTISIKNRQHIRGAGTLDAAFTIGKGAAGNGGYRQHLYAAFGNRQLPQYNQDGLLADAPLFGANYYKVQMDGELPHGGFFNKMGYFFNVSGKEDGYSEFYYNREEQPKQNTVSLSIYGKKKLYRGELTTGLTATTTFSKHDNLSFCRNIIDQDGESLEPWMADGRTQEISWSISAKKSLLSWLTFKADCYNSLLAFSPTTKTWENDVYMQHTTATTAVPLYTYQWTSEAFAGAILENTFSVVANKDLGKKVRLSANAGLTLDGMILKENTKITPNAEAGIALDMHPWKWLQIGFDIQHSRMAYDIETLRFMSTRYMNANVYSEATGNLFSTTGGKFHHYAKHLWQPSFVSLSIPVKARFGRHELALIQTYKKFYHTWMTEYEGGAEANGFYVETPLTEDVQQGNNVSFASIPVYYLSPGTRDYVVGYMSSGLMGNGFFTNTPFVLSQESRYTYYGKKVQCGIAWQSMEVVGYSAWGSGPGSNNIGILSETTANPNNFVVIKNAEGVYPAVGRCDQDRAYEARIFFSYNINKHFEIGGTGNWTDGQPFVYYRTFALTDDVSLESYKQSDNPGQIAVVNGCSRGINTTDGNFGCRESAIFHIDIHVLAKWQMLGKEMSLYVQSYNAYDFGNVFNEFCFPQGYREGRGPNMCLTIPRGLIFTYKMKI